MRITTVSVQNYRSLRELRLAPGNTTIVTGANGVGKSNLYRALELLFHAAHGRLAWALAREGGMPSVQWAGPELPQSPRARFEGQPIQGTVRRRPTRIRLGIGFDGACFECTLGLPGPVPGTVFALDPEVKEEWLWHASPRRKANTWLTRKGPSAACVDSDGGKRDYTELDPAESVLSQLREPKLFPELHQVREAIRGFRFYHGFRTDVESPLRMPQVGVRTPVLSADGSDLAAALQTILEVGDAEALRDAVCRGLNARLEIRVNPDCHFEVTLAAPGLLRSLGARELSDGSLRYLALVAALHSPRPAPMLVFNEPEASLHPSLLGPLGESLFFASRSSQVWVISHSADLLDSLQRRGNVTHFELERDEQGATIVRGAGLLDVPLWP